MAKEASKLEYFYDSSDAEWSDESTSDYWKRVEDEVFAMLDAEENDKKKLAEDELVGDGRWITIGAREKGTNGEDDEGRKGRHLFLDDGETPQEAIEKLKDGGDKSKDKPKDKPEEKPADKPAEKSVEKPTEEPDEFAGMSDEEVRKKDDELFEKYRKLMDDEKAFVDSDAEVVRLSEERDRLEKMGWNAGPEDYAEIDKKREKVLSDLFDASRNAEERFRKENGYWVDVMKEREKYKNEVKKRNDKAEKVLNDKMADLSARAEKGDFEAGMDALVEMESDALKMNALDRVRSRKKFCKGLAESVLGAYSGVIGKKLSDYNKQTDKFLESLNGYDNKYKEASKHASELNEKANDLWKEYVRMPEGEEKQKAWDEIQKARKVYYSSIDESLAQSRKLVYDIAQKIRESIGDSGNTVGRLKKGSPFCKEMNERLYKLFDGVLGKGVDASEAPRIKKTTASRSCHRQNEGIEISKYSFEGNNSLIHEYGHYLEEKNPRMLLNSRAFLMYRTKGEEVKKMNDFEKGYSNSERTRADKFFHPYCGKVYVDTIDVNDNYAYANASEVMSMGLERLFDEPIKFANEDREYFNFVVANMRGEL